MAPDNNVQPPALKTVLVFFNGTAAVALFYVTAFALEGDGGGYLGAAIFMLMVLITLPGSILLLALYSMLPRDIVPGSPAGAFIALGAFYLVGWVQLAVILPYVVRGLRRLSPSAKTPFLRSSAAVPAAVPIGAALYFKGIAFFQTGLGNLLYFAIVVAALYIVGYIAASVFWEAFCESDRAKT